MDLSNGFDAKDGFDLGAIVGFVDESIKAEEQSDEEEKGEEFDLSGVNVREVNLKLMQKNDPKLFAYALSKCVELQLRWEASQRQKEAEDENWFELQALAETEKLLKD
jgi:chorismate-pyruvate lyase